MAPPRRDIPWVKRSIGFLPTDVEMLEAVRSRLGEPDGSAAIRRLIREAYDKTQNARFREAVKKAAIKGIMEAATFPATHLPAKPAKPASKPEKRPSVALKVRPAFNPQPKTGKGKR